MTRIATFLLALALAAPAGADHHEVGEAPKEPEAAAPAATESGAAAPEAPAQTGEVVRTQITSDVVDREPTDDLETVPADRERVSFFTELRGFQGQEVVHRWEHAGEVKAEVPFQVAGPRWRVYSIKSLDPSWTGEWRVSVVDAQGDVVASESFELLEVSATPSSPALPAALSDEPVPASPIE